MEAVIPYKSADVSSSKNCRKKKKYQESSNESRLEYSDSSSMSYFSSSFEVYSSSKCYYLKFQLNNVKNVCSMLNQSSLQYEF